MKAKMKKLSLFLLVSVFAFCGCSDENDEVKGGDDNKGGENEKKEAGEVKQFSCGAEGKPSLNRASSLFPDSGG